MLNAAIRKLLKYPGHGPSFHTSEFMDGYNAGLNSCGGRVEEMEGQMEDLILEEMEVNRVLISSNGSVLL